MVDVRFLPGQRDLVLERIKQLAGPDITIDIEMGLIAMEAPFDGSLVKAVIDTLGVVGGDPPREIA
ncbi:hypothetical protein EV643_12560 [Kribbella sp. VKM Ac-2527]|uniref:Uncharacterized protein n=1 Tax=Kribbella caucasensis TaxID=2512215 RepID=A0A4R6JFQ2_9ACTN|nr:hypothetical protein [Kribbella sp. VKM Ac-2527]TDO34803.1 hypothetical protein EV643_12560 [Kribbella sp. VKM Ac-2527]